MKVLTHQNTPNSRSYPQTKIILSCKVCPDLFGNTATPVASEQPQKESAFKEEETDEDEIPDTMEDEIEEES